MFCNKCGAQIDDQAAFCDKCGATLQKPQAVTAAPPPAYPTAVEYAGFWKRLLAFLIDSLIIGAVQVVLSVVLFTVGVISTSDLGQDATVEEYRHAMLITYIVIAACLSVEILFFALMESSSFQATPGKMVVGIKVTSMDETRVSRGRAIGRNLIKFAPGVISTGLAIVIFAVASDPKSMGSLASLVGFLLALSYIVIAFTAKKQAIHDMIANCLVVVKQK